MEKLVSVIIPCYNVREYVDRCINSLVRQTIGIEKLELILVDDASTDDTLKRLYQWEKRYPKSIKVVACEKNGRQGTARNIGMQYATASYIGFVDSDDWVELDMYEQLYQAAIAWDVDVTACRMGRDCGDGRLCHIKPYNGRALQKIEIHNSEDRRRFFRDGFSGGVYCRLYRKEFLRENQIQFPDGLTYEDNYFVALVNYCLKSIYIIDQVYYHYFYNASATVSSRNASHQLDRLQIELMKLEEFQKRGLDQEFHQEIMESFLHLYYINSLHLIFKRYDHLPYDVLNQMKKEVLERFPEYKESQAYASLTSLEKGFLLTLETEMTEERWERLANNYREISSRTTPVE